MFPKKSKSIKEIIIDKREYFRNNLYDKYNSSKKEKKKKSLKNSFKSKKKDQILSKASKEERKKILMKQSHLPGNMMDSESYLKKKHDKIKALEKRLFEERCTFKPSIRNVPNFISKRLIIICNLNN